MSQLEKTFIITESQLGYIVRHCNVIFGNIESYAEMREPIDILSIVDKVKECPAK